VSPRANWKGVLKIDDIDCPVALYTAVSTSDRIAFHTINRATGNRVRREYVDGETEKLVSPEDQVKGYKVGKDDYVILEADEAAAAVPESDKTLSVEAFVDCADIDDLYFDRPYYLGSGDKHADDSFALVREAMRGKGVAAIARTVLFRRVHTLLIRPHGGGFIAATLNYDYEVRPVKQAFDSVPSMKIKGEMLQLAEHIIKTKQGEFDPSSFEDRYENALAELVKAKLEGRKIAPPKRPKVSKVTDLMEALRQSAQPARNSAAPKPRARRAAKAKDVAPRRRAG
jgi:DNA end-binding protein Ku